MKIASFGLFVICCSYTEAIQQPTGRSCRSPTNLYSENGRRSFVTSLVANAAGGAALLFPKVSHAGIEPSLLKNLPVQGDESGSQQRLRQIEAIQRPSSDIVDIPFTELPSGVSYREYREGKGEAIVQNGSKVAAEMTIRCKSFSTQNEPAGVKYFSTKDDTEFNEIFWTVGSGEILPGLEEGMMGMHK
jgi:hypothetical protein